MPLFIGDGSTEWSKLTEFAWLLPGFDELCLALFCNKFGKLLKVLPIFGDFIDFERLNFCELCNNLLFDARIWATGFVLDDTNDCLFGYVQGSTSEYPEYLLSAVWIADNVDGIELG